MTVFVCHKDGQQSVCNVGAKDNPNPQPDTHKTLLVYASPMSATEALYVIEPHTPPNIIYDVYIHTLIHMKIAILRRSAV